MTPEPASIFGLSGDELKLALTIFYVVVWCLIALVGTIISYKLLKAVFALFRTFGSVFGETVTSKLISLGLASLVFPSVIPDILTGLALIVYTLIDRLPKTFYLPAEVISNADRGHLGDIVIRLLASMLTSWCQAFNAALRTVWDLPIKDTVLMIALAAVLGLVFREVESDREPGVRRDWWLGHFFRSLEKRKRQNLAFVTILAIAGYLSIASIAAIPALTEAATPGAEVSAENLKQRLESLRQEANAGLKELTSHADPFAKLQEIQQAAERTDAPATTGIDSSQRVVLAERDKIALTKFLRQATEVGNSRLQAHAQLVNRLKKQNNDEANWAVEEYQANTVERKGRREAVRYYYNMIQWYRYNVGKRQAQSEWSAKEVERRDGEAAGFADEIAETLKAAGTGTAPREGIIADRAGITLGYFTAPLQAPPSGQDDALVPARPALGSDLGPFTLVASWLLHTESLSLALIVGMIGFGLLGSACSSFIREKKDEAGEGQPMVRDLSGVIIRGCSAAVVVFLAAKGGLAIFGSGAAEPNPYVLLLTCLVAAVFSDVVWDRAQAWFRSLGRRQDTSGKSRGRAAPRKSGATISQTPNASPH